MYLLCKLFSIFNIRVLLSIVTVLLSIFCFGSFDADDFQATPSSAGRIQRCLWKAQRIMLYKESNPDWAYASQQLCCLLSLMYLTFRFHCVRLCSTVIIILHADTQSLPFFHCFNMLFFYFKNNLFYINCEYILPVLIMYCMCLTLNPVHYIDI